MKLTPGACVIKLFTAVIDYRGKLLPRYRIPRYFFLFDVIKTFKKNSRVFYPNMTVIYPEILTLEKEGFLNFLTDK